MPGRTFTTFLDHAQGQYGYLTPDDARDLGVDPVQLRLMAARGTIDHLGHGLYRMREVPPTELDPYMEAVLWTGRRGGRTEASCMAEPPGAGRRPSKLPGNRSHLQQLVSKHAAAEGMAPRRVQRWLNAMVVTGVLDRVRDENDEPIFRSRAGWRWS